jgi:hypothetical protein
MWRIKRMIIIRQKNEEWKKWEMMNNKC